MDATCAILIAKSVENSHEISGFFAVFL